MFNKFEVVGKDVRYDDDSCDGVLPDQQPWSNVVAAHGSDVISGTGSLDVLRYGGVLQPRKLVGVRGAGIAYDGYYYVKSVTHNIKHGEYKQSFALSRNALIPTTQSVAV